MEVDSDASSVAPKAKGKSTKTNGSKASSKKAPLVSNTSRPSQHDILMVSLTSHLRSPKKRKKLYLRRSPVRLPPKPLRQHREQRRQRKRPQKRLLLLDSHNLALVAVKRTRRTILSSCLMTRIEMRSQRKTTEHKQHLERKEDLCVYPASNNECHAHVAPRERCHLQTRPVWGDLSETKSIIVTNIKAGC